MINDIGAWFIDVNTTSTYAKTYTFSVDGYEDVSAEILVSVDTGSDGSSKVYNLAATFTNGADSEHPCRVVLTMEGKLTEERNLRRYRAPRRSSPEHSNGIRQSCKRR